MGLGEAAGQRLRLGSSFFKCPAFFICNRLQPKLWRVHPTYRNSLRTRFISALILPFYLLHSFPWSLSLPKEGASLLYSFYCWIVFLHSHAGPPDTSVPRTHGRLRKSCECLSRLRPQGRGRKSKRLCGKEMGICCMEMNMPVLIVCSLFNFHYQQWNPKVEQA